MKTQKYVPDNYCGGRKNWRLFVIHYVAWALGVLIHVEGFPLGTNRNMNRDAYEQ